jgi:hypothetical protein
MYNLMPCHLSGKLKKTMKESAWMVCGLRFNPRSSLNMKHECYLLDQYVWLFTFNIIALFYQFAHEDTIMKYI